MGMAEYSSSTNAAKKSFLGTEDLQKPQLILRALLAELIGTLLLVYIGCGAVVSANNVAAGSSGVEFNPAGVVKIALAFGFIITCAVQIFGHVSGAHLNPAVTIGLLACGRIGLLTAIAFIPVQCVGAIVGSALLKYSTQSVNSIVGATTLSSVIDAGQGVAIEAVISAILILVVCAVTDPNRGDLGNIAAIAIGLAIVCSHLFAVPLTGSGMNPARSLGPAVIGQEWSNHWVYWVGPLVGGFVAGLVYRFIFSAPKEEESSYDLS